LLKDAIALALSALRRQPLSPAWHLGRCGRAQSECRVGELHGSARKGGDQVFVWHGFPPINVYG
jgi:hypothetical protein